MLLLLLIVTGLLWQVNCHGCVMHMKVKHCIPYISGLLPVFPFQEIKETKVEY